MARTPRPPTTPPTMAPVLLLELPEFVAGGEDVDGDAVGVVDAAEDDDDSDEEDEEIVARSR